MKRFCANGVIGLGSIAIVLLVVSPACSAESYISQARAKRPVLGESGVTASSARAASMLAAPIAVGRTGMTGAMAVPGSNLASVMQTGTSNIAAISQSGAGNSASIIQSGAGNYAVISQR